MISSIFCPRSDFRIRMVQVQQSIQNTSNDRSGVGFCSNYSLDIQHLSIGMSRDSYAMRREFVYTTMLNHGIIWEKRSCTVSFFRKWLTTLLCFCPFHESDKSYHFMMLKLLTFSAKHLHFQIRSRPQYTSSIHKLQPPKLSTASIQVTRRSNLSPAFEWKNISIHIKSLFSSGLVFHYGTVHQ